MIRKKSPSNLKDGSSKIETRNKPIVKVNDEQNATLIFLKWSLKRSFLMTGNKNAIVIKASKVLIMIGVVETNTIVNRTSMEKTII